jgi:multidrug efflux pump subunit AcrA (membrane-fusion protein)
MIASGAPLVQVVGPATILVRPDTPLARNLAIVDVKKQTVAHPLLTVTGSVVARIRPGSEPLRFRWQFASPEVASAYTDWLKSSVDIEFNQKQLDTTRELSNAQIERYDVIVKRLAPLAPEGNVPLKELRAAEADLVQAKLQGQKDVFEAESLLRAAQRRHTALERQLSQAGVEPVVLSRATEGMVLVTANVPEAKISLVQVGQSCQARFFAFPGKEFAAHVEELGSVLSTERRTLRVSFELNDTKDLLKPGMFAEIGLGTDQRDAVLIPTTAVLHLGRADYVFVQDPDGKHLRVVEVQVSESPGEFLEVLDGLKPGDRIVSSEAVLLKPLAVQSLAPRA